MHQPPKKSPAGYGPDGARRIDPAGAEINFELNSPSPIGQAPRIAAYVVDASLIVIETRIGGVA